MSKFVGFGTIRGKSSSRQNGAGRKQDHTCAPIARKPQSGSGSEFVLANAQGWSGQKSGISRLAASQVSRFIGTPMRAKSVKR